MCESATFFGFVLFFWSPDATFSRCRAGLAAPSEHTHQRPAGVVCWHTHRRSGLLLSDMSALCWCRVLACSGGVRARISSTLTCLVLVYVILLVLVYVIWPLCEYLGREIIMGADCSMTVWQSTYDKLILHTYHSGCVDHTIHTPMEPDRSLTRHKPQEITDQDLHQHYQSLPFWSR